MYISGNPLLAAPRVSTTTTMQPLTLKSLLPLSAPVCTCATTTHPCLQRHTHTDGFRIPPHRIVIDAHVHIFPPRLMSAVWRFFDQHYWPVVYKDAYADSQVDFLIDQGVRHVVLLQYAHKDGIARGLNEFMATTVRRMNEKYGMKVATGLATVMPGEEDACGILEEAFTRWGLMGVKLHSHVQVIAANDPKMDPLYTTCAAHNRPILLHAGREPNSAAYKQDTYELCSASRIDDVLTCHPTLRLCVPHMGWNETELYVALLKRHRNLYLDTTMMLSDLFPTVKGTPTRAQLAKWMGENSDRILYGTDFPNISYTWHTEFANLCDEGEYRLEEEVLERILYKNAMELYGIGKDGLGVVARSSL
ncbi:amidohydrolase family protein [Jimgerdemannia flammicorona]|uniref:Amidohydrolase family protein n=2 Tax=Jimgerdemannia flammicorona TaxID=994334 RepID=A0A433D5P9_9FUNG|nr:amidohydrolase family protein [Jimgerdemannia flammicorona]RUS31400.1 amidohydrolase family protein [Jimgerdemannia flammicorona]